MRPHTATTNTADTVNAARSIVRVAQRLLALVGSPPVLVACCCAVGELRLGVKCISIVVTVKASVLLFVFRKKERRRFREAQHLHWFAEGFLHGRLASCGDDAL